MRLSLVTLGLLILLSWSALAQQPGSTAPGMIAPGVRHTGVEYGAYDVKVEIPSHAKDILRAGQKGETLSVAGDWKCVLDSKRLGLAENWQKRFFDLPIRLPGSPSINDLQFTRPRLVPTAHCARFGNQQGDGGQVSAAAAKTSHFDRRG